MNEPRSRVLCRSSCLLACMAGLMVPAMPLAGKAQSPTLWASAPSASAIMPGWQRVPVRWAGASRWRHAKHVMQASSFTSGHDLPSTARMFTQAFPFLAQLLVGRDAILLSGWHAGMHWVVQVHAGRDAVYGLASAMRADASLPQAGSPLASDFNGMSRDPAAIAAHNAGPAWSMPHWIASQGRLALALESMRDGQATRQQVYVFPYPVTTLRRMLAQAMAQDGWRPDAVLAGMPELAVWYRRGAQLWLMPLQEPSSSALYLEIASEG